MWNSIKITSIMTTLISTNDTQVSYLDPSHHFPPLTSFSQLRHITFIDFFMQNNLDLPPFFNKSKSLYRLNVSNWFLKYNTLLLKRGFKEKLISHSSVILFMREFEKKKNWDLNLSLPLQFITLPSSDIPTHLLNTFPLKDFSLNYLTNQVKILTFETKLKVASLFTHPPVPSSTVILRLHDPSSKSLIIQINNPYFNEMDHKKDDDLFTTLHTITPIFDFFIYKTPKLIWKYSRGKTGRFFIVWKFIPPFKRTSRVLRWVAAAIKFETNFQIQNKIITNWGTLNEKKILRILWDRKKFSHNYIFREARFSSMKTFKPIK